MELIRSYFPDLSDAQAEMLSGFQEQLLWWNERINLISRQDTTEVESRHLLHALAIAKWIRFRTGTRILDLGTGGGLPGIPLAILFPDSDFTLVDSRGKKIQAVRAMIASLGLANARAIHGRAEDLAMDYEFIVTRAVAPLTELVKWTFRKSADPPGLIALKGGDLRGEIKALGRGYEVMLISIHEMFPLDVFEDKYLVYVRRVPRP